MPLSLLTKGCCSWQEKMSNKTVLMHLQVGGGGGAAEGAATNLCLHLKFPGLLEVEEQS